MLTMMLAMCIFCFAPITVQAAGGTFGGGNGTSGNPYIIEDAADLDAVRNARTLHYKLGNDVDLTAYLADGGAGYAKWTTSGWLPIGTFSGSLNGDGHEITGLWINRTATNNIGLFVETNGAIIENLGVVIDNANNGVRGNASVGGLVGSISNSTDNIIISNCYVSGNVTGSSYYVGGLVGYNYRSTISECYATGSVTGNGHNVGGLVGYNSRSTISKCYATGNVTGNSTEVGGLVGGNNGSTISNSYATGDVTGNNRVGGLVGLNAWGMYSNSWISPNGQRNAQIPLPSKAPNNINVPAIYSGSLRPLWPMDACKAPRGHEPTAPGQE